MTRVAEAKVMMFPLVGIARKIHQEMSAYRELFSRQSAFEHVERYVQGLLLSANKTLQGIYSQLVWPDASERVERRAMHAGVFESPWDREQLMVQHRGEVQRRNGKRKNSLTCKRGPKPTMSRPRRRWRGSVN